MEIQCKERVDLLEDLRTRRLEKAEEEKEASNGGTTSFLRRGNRSQSNTSIQAQSQLNASGRSQPSPIQPPQIKYADLGRPALPPRQNPQTQSSTSLRPSIVQKQSERSDPFPSRAGSPILMPPPTAPLRKEKKEKKDSRTPSPEKKTTMFRTTLRSAPKDSSKATSMTKMMSKARQPPTNASKAATLAWPAGVPPPPSPSLGGPAAATALTNSNSARPSPRPSHSDLKVRSKSPSYPISPEPRSNDHASRAAMSPAVRRARERVSSDHDPEPLIQPLKSSPASKPPAPPPHTHGLNVKPAPVEPRVVNPKSNGVSLPAQLPDFPSYRKEFRPTETQIDSKTAQQMARKANGMASGDVPVRSAPAVTRRKPIGTTPSSPSQKDHRRTQADANDDRASDADLRTPPATRHGNGYFAAELPAEDTESANSQEAAWDARVAHLMKNLPRGVDEQAAKAIFNEIVVKGDEVHWDDVAGLDIAKTALKEAVVYPFLRPDLFMGLREPARGMLLFGPPGTGKTMLARAVATESKSTFFAISASSLTSKFLGESEKLVRALFQIAKALAPSIIFVDEIDSLLGSRSGSGEHEATRRIKTEFLIQWSDLQKAAAGREQTNKEIGDASRVLVLAATNLPWAIDEAARRRFVRRQYIPLPEDHVRASQLKKLMAAQKDNLKDIDLKVLVNLTDGKCTFAIKTNVNH